jgi:hypothetical protein
MTTSQRIERFTAEPSTPSERPTTALDRMYDRTYERVCQRANDRERQKRQDFVRASTWEEYFRTYLRAIGADVPHDTTECVRAALSSVHGVDMVAAEFTIEILNAFKDSPDNLEGWTHQEPLPNYLVHKIAYSDIPVKLSPIGRHGTAATISCGVSVEGWQIARFGCRFEIDEQDLIDGESISVTRVALSEIGRAIRRLPADAAWSLLIRNPNLADGVPLFDTSRGNIASGGPSAFSATSLGVAYSGIASQTLTDEQGDAAHLNCQPTHLMVPPDDAWAARIAARDASLGDGSDLIVRAESRLSIVGFADPQTDDIILGNGNNWLLASSQAPGIVIGLLDGKSEPTIRSYQLGQGSFGIGFDVSFSFGVCAVGGKGLFWSVGE